MRTFEYRLYPNRQQCQQLMACLIASRHLYNKMLEATKAHYAEGYKHICVEHLNIDGMLQNHHLAKSIADASWGTFIEILAAKAASAVHQVIKVPARFTSQKCYKCGKIVQKSLSVRTHICPFCGYVEDRDVNAAKNILAAGTLPSGVNVHH